MATVAHPAYEHWDDFQKDKISESHVVQAAPYFPQARPHYGVPPQDYGIPQRVGQQPFLTGALAMGVGVALGFALSRTSHASKLAFKETQHHPKRQVLNQGS